MKKQIAQSFTDQFSLNFEQFCQFLVLGIDLNESDFIENETLPFIVSMPVIYAYCIIHAYMGCWLGSIFNGVRVRVRLLKIQERLRPCPHLADFVSQQNLITNKRHQRISCLSPVTENFYRLLSISNFHWLSQCQYSNSCSFNGGVAHTVVTIFFKL